MSKKSYFRAAGLAGIGAIIGLLISGFFNNFFEDGGIRLSELFNGFLVNSFMYILLLVFLGLFLPAIVNLQLAKKKYKVLDSVSEDEIDQAENACKRHLDLALLFNMTHLVVTFAVFSIGLSADITIASMIIGLAYLIICLVSMVIIEYSAIGTLQKYDTRIKGDPSKFNFQKEYLGSCDEAEKLEIYKASYKSFQLTKNVGLIIFIFAVLITMEFEVGVWPVLLTGAMFLVQIISFGMYGMNKK